MSMGDSGLYSGADVHMCTRRFAQLSIREKEACLLCRKCKNYEYYLEKFKFIDYERHNS